MKVDRILVPVDGSVLAEQAVYRAMDLASQLGAGLLLLRAGEAHTFPGADPTQAQVSVMQEAEEYVTTLAQRLTGGGFARVETSVWYGEPAACIIDAARTRKVDLIVMTSHGRSGLGRLIMGSVAESVLRGTTTPILLLREAGAPVDLPRGAAREAAGHV
jgi:nucleotide-binding universal stress UspA family protein